LPLPPPVETLCPAPCLERGAGFECPRLRCLIQAAREGDRVSCEFLFARLYPPALRHARQLCRSFSDAEDLAQNALLTAFRALAQLRDCHRVQAWLWRIVKNSHRMSIRRETLALIPIEDAPPVRSSLADPAQLLLARDFSRRTANRLRGLPPTLRRVFELRVVADLSTQETARRLCISSEAVRTRLSRARRALPGC
jgi:RNA polymerase sigma-70 factor (ECF subfamily)